MKNKRRYLKINTIDELGKQLGLPPDFLINIADRFNQQYHSGQIEKKGKIRDVYKAHNSLKLIHKSINELLDKLHYPDNIQGGVRERSIITNASKHIGKKYVANFDIKNFFPSVKFWMIDKIFRDQKCVPKVADLLTRLTTADRQLPQGFATSPKISGLILFKINSRLENFFKKLGLIHSFWIDDLTVSGNRKIDKGIEKMIRKIFRQSGFELHGDEKTYFANYSEKQKCIGLIINKELNADKIIRRKVSQQLHACEKYGIDKYLEATNNPIGKDLFLQILIGKINFLVSINAKNIIYKEQLEKLLGKK